MSALPLPPKATTNRELLQCARAIERRVAQKRKLLAQVAELDGRIREAKRMFRALTELIASPADELALGDRCPYCAQPAAAHELGGYDTCAQKHGVTL